jgi:hypothetical protein
MWTSVATGTSALLGVNISGPNAATTDNTIASLLFNVNSVHTNMSGTRYISNVPAGDYTMDVRWRRNSGTGTMNLDAGDQVSISVVEVGQ